MCQLCDEAALYMAQVEAASKQAARTPKHDAAMGVTAPPAAERSDDHDLSSVDQSQAMASGDRQA